MHHPNVLFVTAELNPLAKVGGLADVAGALPKALFDQGIDVQAVLPLYDVIDRDAFDVEPTGESFTVAFGDVSETVSVYSATIPGSSVPIILLDNPTYLGNGGVYGSKTAIAGTFKEIQRFAFYSFAIAEYVKQLEAQPEIIHCNDWHTALVPSVLKLRGLEKIRTIETIHTMGNQGPWNERELREFVGDGIDLSDDNDTDGVVRILVNGIKSADWVTTVSPTYAQEMLTPEYGAGVHEFLQKKQGRTAGILNGIDTEVFSPASDPDIVQQYTLKTLDQKKANKEALQRELKLPQTDAVLYGLVSRLTIEQKGIDIILDSLPELAKLNAQFVFLGTGEEILEKRLREASEEYPNVAAKLDFDAVLAQHIYAGSDAFLMPSRYEPCGLGQMIAMRYGTIPVVRDTGGLHDTVPPHTSEDGRGFVFTDSTPAAFTKIIQTATDVYHNDHKRWMELVHNGMSTDFSWEASAREYIHLYDQVMIG